MPRHRKPAITTACCLGSIASAAAAATARRRRPRSNGQPSSSSSGDSRSSDASQPAETEASRAIDRAPRRKAGHPAPAEPDHTTAAAPATLASIAARICPPVQVAAAASATDNTRLTARARVSVPRGPFGDRRAPPAVRPRGCAILGPAAEAAPLPNPLPTAARRSLAA